jgi:hypothetical protein
MSFSSQISDHAILSQFGPGMMVNPAAVIAAHPRPARAAIHRNPVHRHLNAAWFSADRRQVS